jgi:NAD(P)-dependent dehydrogenase (short-subunit alcohol dehydrogenase family)
MRLDGKVAIVTGGGSGIGHHTCLQFASEGARVLVVDILGEKAKRIAKEITDKGGIAEACAEDVSNEEGAKNIASRAESLWNRIDVLVNNAASFHHKSTEEATYTDWETVLKVNVMGTGFCSKYAVPIMKRQKSGSIIHVASINGLVATSGEWMIYNASKAAIVNMAKSMAIEYAPFGIRANCVCPGMIYTPAMETLLGQMGKTRKEAEVEFLGPRCMLKRFGESWEIAPVLVLLASDEASYITGATFVADGGYTS